MQHLVLEEVSKAYGTTQALQKIDLSVKKGELLTLLGPSGCGKTTVLRLVAGFLAPTGGSIRVAEADVTRIPPHQRDIGMVFQHYALFPHLSIARNIAFGLEERGYPRADIRRRVGQLLDLIRLSEDADRFPAQLSGGQQQRVALARAVAYTPQLLLMDEPLGALDLKLREAMQLEVRRIQRELGITTLYVTHDQTEAMRISDRIAIMNKGRIEQVGSASDIYETPANCFVADFLGKINFIPAQVLSIEHNTMHLRSVIGEMRTARVDGFVAGNAITLGIRPDEIEVDPADIGGDMIVTTATLQERSFLGNLIEMQVKLTDGITAMVWSKPAAARHSPGDQIRLGYPVSRLRAFGQ